MARPSSDDYLNPDFWRNPKRGARGKVQESPEEHLFRVACLTLIGVLVKKEDIVSIDGDAEIINHGARVALAKEVYKAGRQKTYTHLRGAGSQGMAKVTPEAPAVNRATTKWEEFKAKELMAKIEVDSDIPDDASELLDSLAGGEED